MFRLVPLPLIPMIANISQTLREFHETLGILSDSVLAAMVAQLRMRDLTIEIELVMLTLQTFCIGRMSPVLDLVSSVSR
jgi:hypothetical protein